MAIHALAEAEAVELRNLETVRKSRRGAGCNCMHVLARYRKEHARAGKGKAKGKGKVIQTPAKLLRKELRSRGKDPQGTRAEMEAQLEGMLRAELLCGGSGAAQLVDPVEGDGFLSSYAQVQSPAGGRLAPNTLGVGFGIGTGVPPGTRSRSLSAARAGAGPTFGSGLIGPTRGEQPPRARPRGSSMSLSPSPSQSLPAVTASARVSSVGIRHENLGVQAPRDEVPQCPCAASGAPCHPEVCACSCGDCCNPTGLLAFDSESVRAYRTRILSGIGIGIGIGIDPGPGPGPGLDPGPGGLDCSAVGGEGEGGEGIGSGEARPKPNGE